MIFKSKNRWQRKDMEITIWFQDGSWKNGPEQSASEDLFALMKEWNRTLAPDSPRFMVRITMTFWGKDPDE
jgi:hypothetical protein